MRPVAAELRPSYQVQMQLMQQRQQQQQQPSSSSEYDEPVSRTYQYRKVIFRFFVLDRKSNAINGYNNTIRLVSVR